VVGIPDIYLAHRECESISAACAAYGHQAAVSGIMLSVSETAFIGIDLAWRGEKPSGGAVLKGDRRCARLIEVVPLVSFAAVLAFVETHAKDPAVVAIDAPLIIRNHTGQRRCETAVSKYYGARHASCHTSNLSLYPDPVSVRLASELISRGFRHAPDVTHPENGLVMLEVYPHAALIELFRLPRILRYKKGNIATKRSGQRDLQQRLRGLSLLAPPLEPTARLSEYLGADVNSVRGAALKAYEDGLDAILCAYIAYYYWFWGSGGTRLFGDMDSGYIIVPAGPNNPPQLNQISPRAV